MKNKKPYDIQKLVDQIDILQAWKGKEDFDEDSWGQYIRLARKFQKLPSPTAELVLDQFIQSAVKSQNEAFEGYENESKAFILIRIMFDLPENVPYDKRISFKGWSNWPEPDQNGMVNLAWPLAWKKEYPELEASYEGSMGQPYAAKEEYRYFLKRYPFRKLDKK